MVFWVFTVKNVTLLHCYSEKLWVVFFPSIFKLFKFVLFKIPGFQIESRPLILGFFYFLLNTETQTCKIHSHVFKIAFWLHSSWILKAWLEGGNVTIWQIQWSGIILLFFHFEIFAIFHFAILCMCTDKLQTQSILLKSNKPGIFLTIPLFQLSY